MTSFFNSAWNIHQSVSERLRTKKSTANAVSSAEKRKQWIRSIQQAVITHNTSGLTDLLAVPRLKSNDLDVFGVLAAHYSDEMCTLLHKGGLSLQLNSTHFPHLLKQNGLEFIRRLAREPSNCVFSTTDKLLHQTLWDGMSGLYTYSIRTSFSTQFEPLERCVAASYIRELEAQFPQLTQDPYRTYYARVISPLGWLNETIPFLEQHADVIEWDKHFPRHTVLDDVRAFLELCERSAIVAEHYAQSEKRRRTAAEISRKLAKCFEGKDGIPSTYPAFSMVTWIKGCAKETQEDEFNDDILLLKRTDHLLLGHTPKDMYLINRGPHPVGGPRRTRHGSWDLPTLTPLSWFHEGVAAGGEIVEVMLQSFDGVACLAECLTDPSVLMGFLGRCSIVSLQQTLEKIPALVRWRDAYNNSIGHYIALNRSVIPKGLADVLIKMDCALFTEPNCLGYSAVDVMRKNGAAVPLNLISNKILAHNIRCDGRIQKKIRGRTNKRRM